MHIFSYILPLFVTQVAEGKHLTIAFVINLYYHAANFFIKAFETLNISFNRPLDVHHFLHCISHFRPLICTRNATCLDNRCRPRCNFFQMQNLLLLNLNTRINFTNLLKIISDCHLLLLLEFRHRTSNAIGLSAVVVDKISRSTFYATTRFATFSAPVTFACAIS